MKFLHTMIRVKDLEKSEEFYRELGFKESRRKDFPEDKFTLVYLKLDESEYELELTYNYDREEDYELGNGYGHIAISHKDIEKFRDELKSKGYEVTNLSGLSDGSASYFFVVDPDGYKIEIIEEK
ncbi:VOC family protein [Peptoniphilus sp. MSJ-1]|uniref:Aldoketomutase n=1 Tax=Peptoniphilus ovalis TaxID=2841503 RepID=A0ABS6FJ08_9FIRM|nr:VOC family protein [Peptoniphilus ovalis]MBU5670161.1 VOC family protein [Peptoniphilus ovalis]